MTARKRRLQPCAEPDETGPLVLVEHGVRGTRITATNAAARAAGAAIGQMLTDARAACPHLMVEQADAEADDDMLQRLALWCQRITPVTAIDTSAATDTPERDFGLLLDTTGCDHLHGGEEAMVADLMRRFDGAGYTVQMALAPTPGAAHALARYGHGADNAATVEQALALLADAPVEALRLEMPRTILLRRLGLKTLGAVVRVPRQALERRFRAREDARSVQMRCDQLTGAIREPLTPLRPPAPWRVTMPCPEPALDGEAIRFALGDLLARLLTRMEQAGKGAQGWRLICFHADGGQSGTSIRLSRPSRDRSHILHLFNQRIDEIDPGYGIDGFLLEAVDDAAIAATQDNLITATRKADQANATLAVELSGLVDRLTNRFGRDTVTRTAPAMSHIPERAWTMVAAGSVVAWEEVAAQTVFRTAARPFRLFDRPEEAQVTAEVPDGPPLNFRWRRISRQIHRARGPERIAPEW